jgi:hypothetical protein
VKTLILTDENFERLLDVLGESEAGADLIRAFSAKPQLPPDRELVALGRDKNTTPPEAVALARAYRDAGRQAAEDTRESMEELLLYCHGAGVRPVTLGQWFGLKMTRVYEIFSRAATRS